MNEREGDAKKEGMEEWSSRARFSRVGPARVTEEGGRCQLSCKLRELYTHTMVATMVTPDSYESSHH